MIVDDGNGNLFQLQCFYLDDEFGLEVLAVIRIESPLEYEFHPSESQSYKDGISCFFSVGRECLLFQSFCFHQNSFNICVFTYFSSLFDTPTLLNLRVLSAPRTIQICILGAIILHHMLEWLYKPLHFIQQIYCITWFFLISISLNFLKSNMLP